MIIDNHLIFKYLYRFKEREKSLTLQEVFELFIMKKYSAGVTALREEQQQQNYMKVAFGLYREYEGKRYLVKVKNVENA